MPRPKKYPARELSGQERLDAITKLLALGIVRLASREQPTKILKKERDRTGLPASSKRSSAQRNELKRKGKQW